MLSVDLALVWTSAEEVAEQPVAGGLPGAAPSVEVYVDQDLGQQDKVRGLRGRTELQQQAGLWRGRHCLSF